jgi:hypothetical protein
MRYVVAAGACLAVLSYWAVAPSPSGDGFPPLLQSHYDAELARVQMEARIAQAEIDALPDPLAE